MRHTERIQRMHLEDPKALSVPARPPATPGADRQSQVPQGFRSTQRVVDRPHPSAEAGPVRRSRDGRTRPPSRSPLAALQA